MKLDVPVIGILRGVESGFFRNVMDTKRNGHLFCFRPSGHRDYHEH